MATVEKCITTYDANYPHSSNYIGWGKMEAFTLIGIIIIVLVLSKIPKKFTTLFQIFLGIIILYQTYDLFYWHFTAGAFGPLITFQCSTTTGSYCSIPAVIRNCKNYTGIIDYLIVISNLFLLMITPFWRNIKLLTSLIFSWMIVITGLWYYLSYLSGY